MKVFFGIPEKEILLKIIIIVGRLGPGIKAR
jgi:hypothetical protein